MIENIGATGAVRPNQSAMLIWKTAGTIGEVNVRAGDKAKMGDVLATLKSDANLVALQANLTIAQENLAQMISPQAVANARLAVTTAQTNVNNAQTAMNNEQYWQNTSLIPLCLCALMPSGVTNSAKRGTMVAWVGARYCPLPGSRRRLRVWACQAAQN